MCVCARFSGFFALHVCAFACHLHFAIHFMVIVDGLNFIDRSQSSGQPASVSIQFAVASQRASVCAATTNACAKLNLQNIECFLEQIYPPDSRSLLLSLICFAIVCVVCVFVILYLGRVKPKVNILCVVFVLFLDRQKEYMLLLLLLFWLYWSACACARRTEFAFSQPHWLRWVDFQNVYTKHTLIQMSLFVCALAISCSDIFSGTNKIRRRHFFSLSKKTNVMTNCRIIILCEFS